MHAEHNINMCHTDKTCKLQIYRKHLTPFFWNLSEANHAASVDWGLAPCGAPWPHKSSHRYTWRESRFACVMIAKKSACTTWIVFKVHSLRLTLNFSFKPRLNQRALYLYCTFVQCILTYQCWFEMGHVSKVFLVGGFVGVWIFAVLYWELGIYCASQSSNRQS